MDVDPEARPRIHSSIVAIQLPQMSICCEIRTAPYRRYREPRSRGAGMMAACPAAITWGAGRSGQERATSGSTRPSGWPACARGSAWSTSAVGTGGCCCGRPRPTAPRCRRRARPRPGGHRPATAGGGRRRWDGAGGRLRVGPHRGRRGLRLPQPGDAAAPPAAAGRPAVATPGSSPPGTRCRAGCPTTSGTASTSTGCPPTSSRSTAGCGGG